MTVILLRVHFHVFIHEVAGKLEGNCYQDKSQFFDRGNNDLELW